MSYSLRGGLLPFDGEPVRGFEPLRERPTRRRARAQSSWFAWLVLLGIWLTCMVGAHGRMGSTHAARQARNEVADAALLLAGIVVAGSFVVLTLKALCALRQGRERRRIRRRAVLESRFDQGSA